MKWKATTDLTDVDEEGNISYYQKLNMQLKARSSNIPIGNLDFDENMAICDVKES